MQELIIDLKIYDLHYPDFLKAVRRCRRAGIKLEIIYEAPTTNKCYRVQVKGQKPYDFFALGREYEHWLFN